MIEGDGEDVRRGETRIDGRRTESAACQESRRDEQRERHGHLGANQQPAQRRSRYPCAGSVTVAFQCARQLKARGV
jgi:hypothetical protein